ncbi:MAG: DNA polymerase III subunit delta [Candidatus Saccharibacteria bacterium]
MIRTIAGANSFLVQDELDSLVTAFVAEHGDLALERLDGQEAELSKLREAITSLPFLASRKMVILRAPSANKLFAENVAHILEGVPDTTDVIIVEPKVDKRSSYYKYVKSKTAYQECAELDQYALAHWLGGQASDRGGSLSTKDANYLVERVGTNQLALANELDKLLLRSPAISRQTIDELTEAAPQSTIFQLLEAVFAKNLPRAFDLYAEQRALKVEPAQIIAMIAWQLHVLAIIKAASGRSAETIAKEAKLSPYVVSKSQGIARKLTLSKLRALIADLLLIDMRMKREAIDVDEALSHYLLKLAA